MNFIIQTIDRKIIHDFSYALIRAKEQYDWLAQIGFDEKIHIKYIDGFPPLTMHVADPNKYIPVGSVEFVSNYIKQFYPEAEEVLRPLNVPECLFEFAGRPIKNVWNRDDFDEYYKLLEGKDKARLYVKSNHQIKSEFNGPVSYPYDASDFRSYQVSTMIDIKSEWRAIVFHNQVMYVANYSGDCLAFPSTDTIRMMVKAFAPQAPVAYTLDVAVTENNETVVIECHRFFSCGLYGYNDYGKYPKMLSQAWYEMIHPKRQ